MIDSLVGLAPHKVEDEDSCADDTSNDDLVFLHLRALIVGEFGEEHGEQHN